MFFLAFTKMAEWYISIYDKLLYIIITYALSPDIGNVNKDMLGVRYLVNALMV